MEEIKKLSRTLQNAGIFRSLSSEFRHVPYLERRKISIFIRKKNQLNYLEDIKRFMKKKSSLH